MILEILPSSLYGLPNVEVMLKNNESSILFKSLSESLENKKMYLSSVAILVVVRGEQVIQNYDKTNLVVKENEMVILPKDLYVVSDFVAKQNGFEAFIFFIDDQLIKKFFIARPSKKNKINESEIINKIIKINVGCQVSRFVRSFDDVYKKAKNNTALLEIKILEFLLLLECQENSKLLIASLIKPIRKRNIGEFMEGNYLSNLKVSDYAVLTGRSDSTFNRDFKRLFGMAPKKWLIAKRLKKSHELLINTELNVTQVAMEVGYENVSHFIDAYKKAYGITPKSTLIHNND